MSPSVFRENGKKQLAVIDCKNASDYDLFDRLSYVSEYDLLYLKYRYHLLTAELSCTLFLWGTVLERIAVLSICSLRSVSSPESQLVASMTFLGVSWRGMKDWHGMSVRFDTIFIHPFFEILSCAMEHTVVQYSCRCSKYLTDSLSVENGLFLKQGRNSLGKICVFCVIPQFMQGIEEKPSHILRQRSKMHTELLS